MLADFPRGKPYCRACKKAEVLKKARLRSATWYAKNKKRALERDRIKRLGNLEAYRAKGRRDAQRFRDDNLRRAREWRAANPERKRQKDKEWREQNKERKAEVDQRWQKEHRERANENQRRYRQRNPEAVRARSKINGARRRGTASPSHETRDYILILESDPCCFCGEPMADIDHIEPLASGGDGEWDNLTAACRSCNASKHAKSLLDFLLQG